jgi:predicted Rossmann-fold nucleotide-binding protein
MQLRLAEIELEKAKALAEACKSAGARCIIGGNGGVLIQAP